MVDTNLQLDVFRLATVDIAAVELSQLHALSIGVGWPHRAADWEMLREVATGLALQDEIGRVVGSVVWTRYGTDAAMVGMMITSPRLQEQGAGTWLMNEVIARNPGRRLLLTATDVARRLYRSLDFRFERTVIQCQGEAQPPPPAPLPEGTSLRLAEAAGRVAEVAALDALATGLDRSHVLARLARDAALTVIERDGRLTGYAMCRRFGRGHVIGPVIAASDEEATALVAPHVAARAGGFLRLDTPALEGSFARFLAASGLAVFDTVTSMGLVREPWLPTTPEAPRRYGLASQALG